MKTLLEHLTNYADYHRDPRNIATHFVGIPMIVLGITTLLARPAIMVGPIPVSPALLAAVGAMAFYLRLDKAYAVAMAVVFSVAVGIGAAIGAQSTGMWLGAGTLLFVVGWVIQFVGHIFEGRKPAFVDDLVGLLVGPLFIVAEGGFALGMRTDLRTAIEEKVGPTRIRNAAKGD